VGSPEMTKSEALAIISQALGPGWSWLPLPVNAAGSLFLGCLVALIAVACTRYRVDAETPWYEAARLSFPRRSALALTCIGCPTALGTFGYMLTSPLSAVPPAGIAAINVLAGLVGPTLMTWRCSKGWVTDRTPITVRDRFEHLALFLLLRLAPLVPPLLAFWLLPSRPGPSLWLGIVLLGAGAFLTATGVQIRLAERLGLLKAAPERLAAVVARAEARCGTRAHRTYLSSMLFANAFAFVWTRDLLFTRPLVDLLDDAELESVALHELAHLAEPLKVRIMRSAVVPLICALGLARVVHDVWGNLALFAMFIVPVAGVFIARRVARRMEHHADAAARPAGDDTLSYANALEKLYRYNSIPVVLAGRAPIHPHLYDRLTAAGATPNYPRPAPPNMRRSRLSSVLTFGLLVALFAGAEVLGAFYDFPGKPHSPVIRPWVIALRGDHWDFQTAGVDDYEADHLRTARAYLTVSRNVAPRCGYCAFYLGMTLVETGNCAEARKVSEACSDIADERGVRQNIAAARYLKSLLAECVPN
jgi:Zn-dependent protease with chaperone function